MIETGLLHSRNMILLYLVRKQSLKQHRRDSTTLLCHVSSLIVATFRIPQLLWKDHARSRAVLRAHLQLHVLPFHSSVYEATAGYTTTEPPIRAIDTLVRVLTDATRSRNQDELVCGASLLQSDWCYLSGVATRSNSSLFSRSRNVNWSSACCMQAKDVN